MQEIRLPLVDELRSIAQRNNLSMQGKASIYTFHCLILMMNISRRAWSGTDSFGRRQDQTFSLRPPSGLWP